MRALGWRLSTTFLGLTIAACNADGTGPSADSIRLKNVIVFASADRDDRAGIVQLYRIQPDGSNLRPIPLGLGTSVGGPAISPDGHHIALSTGVGDIHVVDADGTNDRDLTAGGGFDAWPAWSPDGTQIAFGSDRDESFGVYDIFVMNADGSGLRKVISGGQTPSWSPDGARLAFTLEDADGRHVFAVRLADGSVTQITGGPYLDDTPSWSPDGSELVFGSTRGTTNELYIVSADGSNIRKLPVAGGSGHWSPDGKRIVFECGGPAGELRVCIIRADGTGFAMLAVDSTVSDLRPSWSP
jgi:Tol biopolymer transport system component